MEVGSPADPLQLAAPAQLGGHGDRVGGFAAPEQVDDRVVDDLVAGAVEVDAAQHLGHIGDGVLGQQHRAQDRLLGGHVLRGRAVARAERRFAGRVGRRAVAPVVGRAVERGLGEPSRVALDDAQRTPSAPGSSLTDPSRSCPDHCLGTHARDDHRQRWWTRGTVDLQGSGARDCGARALGQPPDGTSPYPGPDSALSTGHVDNLVRPVDDTPWPVQDLSTKLWKRCCP